MSSLSLFIAACASATLENSTNANPESINQLVSPKPLKDKLIYPNCSSLPIATKNWIHQSLIKSTNANPESINQLVSPKPLKDKLIYPNCSSLPIATKNWIHQSIIKSTNANPESINQSINQSSLPLFIAACASATLENSTNANPAQINQSISIPQTLKIMFAKTNRSTRITVRFPVQQRIEYINISLNQQTQTLN